VTSYAATNPADISTPIFFSGRYMPKRRLYLIVFS
jgi:hypothetical protein